MGIQGDASVTQLGNTKSLRSSRIARLGQIMKHYILISMTEPSRKDDKPKYADWRESLPKLRALAEATKGVVTLGESSWLIPRDKGMPFLSECIVAGNKCGCQHRTWFLDGEE